MDFWLLDLYLMILEQERGTADRRELVLDHLLQGTILMDCHRPVIFRLRCLTFDKPNQDHEFAWTLSVLPLLVLSLAYLAQSYISPLGPAPHLGFGIKWYGSEVQVPLAQPHSQTKDSGVPVEAVSEAPSEVAVDTAADVDPRPKFKRRIVAVGDIHGDLLNAHRVLQMARVVDEDGLWTGEVDVFVQTGDIIDRGDDTIALYEWIEELREQAHGVGGEVISLLGNHEWMNTIGIYVFPSEIETFESISARQKAVTTGWLANIWASNYTTAARLPLHGLLGPPNTDYPPPEDSRYVRANAGPLSHAAFSFVHGGLAPSYPNLQPFPSAINNISASLFHKLRSRDPQPPPHPPHAYPGLPINQVLEKTGTRRMVMGHTPNLHSIVARCGGKVLIIDTGISHAYGGVLSALSVEYTLEPVSSGGWKEQEVVKALYADQDDELLVHATRDLAGNELL
ncbi:Metallo-dependent phosphatase-like protein [Pisolithus sp. B1]|nr:Metallo-dependent phosphatase-like protein [Pisolithus sp. B1]